ncbi:PREDICTED: subtilisin-like protease SBT5.6 isoform X2 [Ipomoea nil]|uniref:subtilisin-like protease SBT5.6 isoform X1 n=1 Tax=Ipomoea nil TaxID=35883 RepID=UPI000900CAA8|nr:PREDICTED: subtilisin-like protease SBT5.6 isoform X1 [Ipomoea nil]XP_019166772.1 PREDICTED: subtilisin-like protease SBT5.6 isoform X2 [Ipomoea nil]
MKNFSVIVLFLVILNVLAAAASSAVERKVYVVYLGEHSGGKSFKEIEDNHFSFLHSVKGSKEEAKASLVHSYKNVINGFSALLTQEEADRISEMEGVISVFHSNPTEIKPHTTRSWDFVNLLEGINGNSISGGEDLLSKANGGKDVIVGIMDSGVWPESPSFNDEGMEPIPTSWKGICQKGVAFNSSHCNRKVIGARYYLKSYEATFGRLNQTTDFRSPRDVNGHGTHTASTAGGRRVNAAALGGFGGGTASGGAPHVRLAIYKVCWPVPDQTLAEGNTCFADDTLAAFDDAISDGVHVISVSLGSIPKRQYYTQNGIAIGALHAVKRNIVVACSAGNDGPTPSTVANVAPWIITVGASSTDRVFSSPLKLGNGIIIEGQTVTPIRTKAMLPLVYAGNVEIPGTTNSTTTGLCRPGTLSRNLVKGKIVLCLSTTISASQEVQRAGGAATILRRQYNEIQVQAFLHPTTVVFGYELITIVKYIRSDENPMATLLPGETVLGTKPAPVMAPFTSVGPNIIEPNILKPDITAPGLNILAAWSEASSPTKYPFDRRVVKYNIVSGTSMSCPHVSAVAALLKAIHPDWSSAAIRSALMTTATTNNVLGAPILNSTGYLATLFEYGAGHILPSKAADPGLVYDTTYNDYLLYLCNTGVTLDSSFKCPKNTPSASNLNYPSLSIANLQGSITVKRTVTNVAKGNSTYVVTVAPPPGYVVAISPTILRFSQQREKQSFNVIVRTNGVGKRNGFAFGGYSWSDGVHVVSSPIAVSSG